VLVVVSVCGGGGCFFFVRNSVSISSSSSISICFDLCLLSSFPLYGMIALTFAFGFNAWREIFHSFVLPISLHLKLFAPFASPSYEYLTLFPVEKT